MKISKEEAVQDLMSAADNCITESDLREHFEHIIFGLTVDHPKVKLPREVGEELDQFAASYVDVLQFAYHLYALHVTEFPALVNWLCSAERRWMIIDAFRYGWEAEPEAEPEAKWYVKAPESWKADDCGVDWLHKSSRGGVDLYSHTGESDEQFTHAELKKYHLDSDIFTLVPVEDEK